MYMNDESKGNHKSDEKKKKKDDTIEVDMDMDDQVETSPEVIEEQKSPTEKMEEELEEIKKESKKNHNLAMRIQADFDNYKKRMEKERKEFEYYIKQRIYNPILDVIDDFKRALFSLETSLDIDSTSSELLKGVQLTHDQLERILGNEGIKPIKAINEEFDPLKHEVIYIEEKEDYKDNKVIEEFQKGYMLGSRVLRPARVKVSKKKIITKKKEKNDEEENVEEE
jgi:molecular chaperone GrpE